MSYYTIDDNGRITEVKNECTEQNVIPGYENRNCKEVGAFRKFIFWTGELIISLILGYLLYLIIGFRVAPTPGEHCNSMIDDFKYAVSDKGPWIMSACAFIGAIVYSCNSLYADDCSFNSCLHSISWILCDAAIGIPVLAISHILLMIIAFGALILILCMFFG